LATKSKIADFSAEMFKRWATKKKNSIFSAELGKKVSFFQLRCEKTQWRSIKTIFFSVEMYKKASFFSGDVQKSTIFTV
jgi:hypothetical protein